MRRWAVTGPAGGGKSAFCRVLADRGAALIDGDRLGHEILTRQEIVAAIGAAFGQGVVSTGTVDRGALGAIVFAEPEALVRLNLITHGPLATLAGQRLDRLEREGVHRLAVFEAAVYFALPSVPQIDLVITVTASADTRLARLMQRNGLTPVEARALMDAQKPLQEAWDRASFVLDNDGSLSALESVAKKMWSSLKD